MDNLIDITKYKIGVVGAGSWGTALANLLALKGAVIDLWAFEEDVRLQIENKLENETFLPGIKLSPNIKPTGDLEKVSRDKDMILLVVPSHVMRETAEKMKPYVSANTVLVSASKGIENQTYLTMSGVLKEILPDIPEKNFAALSGPSFAREVGEMYPTVVAAASSDSDVAGFVQQIFATPYFRVYKNTDVIGVELGGALKNVIAIAAGISDGLDLSLNTRAAVITRGLAEIRKLGLKFGADPNTFLGLSGVGDLLLTCTGELSRNHTVGKLLGEGKSITRILSEMKMVAEGVKTAKSVYNLAMKLEVELPICEEVYHILYDGYSPRDAVHRLMTRSLKDEFGD